MTAQEILTGALALPAADRLQLAQLIRESVTATGATIDLE